jgi:hypothetical protein
MSCRFLTGITFVLCCDLSSRGVDTMNVPAPHNEKQITTIANFSIRLTDELRFCRLSLSPNAAPNGGDK